MKATAMLRATAVRFAKLYLLVAVCTFGPGAHAKPQQPDRANNPALRIVTEYLPGKMPTAAALLARCSEFFDKSASWTAQIGLRTASTDGPSEVSFVGTLLVDDGSLRAVLRSSGADERTLCMLITAKESTAWMATAGDRQARTDDQPDRERSRLARVAQTIGLLGVLGRLPGDQTRLPGIAAAYEFTNRGVAEADQGRVYVLDVTAKADDQTPAPDPKSAGEQIQVALSLADALPRRIVGRSTDGSWRSLELTSIRSDVSVDDANFSDAPPDGALIIDLAAKEGPRGTLENPVPYGPESIARGKRLYVADCVVCHSIDGTGRDSDVTDNAANLTDTTYWLSDGSDAATFLAIRDGAGEEMPPYKDEYRDVQPIWDLVNYIRSLQKK